MKHVASCSFGKDSIATVLLALTLNEPLDEVVYCEVMFDRDTSGEVPEHRNFIYETAIPAFEKLGVKTKVLRAEKTYVDLFILPNSKPFLHEPSEGKSTLGKYARQDIILVPLYRLIIVDLI